MNKPVAVTFENKVYLYDGEAWLQAGTFVSPPSALLPELIELAELPENVGAVMRLRHELMLMRGGVSSGQRALDQAGRSWARCRSCDREDSFQPHLTCSGCGWTICRCGRCECWFRDNESKFLRQAALCEMDYHGYCRTEGRCMRCGQWPLVTRRLYRLVVPDGSILEYGPECYRTHLVDLLDHYAKREGDSPLGTMLRLNLANLKGSFRVVED